MADELTTGQSELSDDAVGNADEPGASYYYIRQYDKDGNYVGMLQYETGQAKNDLVSAIGEAYSDTLDTVQNAEASTPHNEQPLTYGDFITVSMVLIVAMFITAGAVCVQTLIRSFERVK